MNINRWAFAALQTVILLPTRRQNLPAEMDKRVPVCTCMFTSATPAAENAVPERDDATLFQSQSSNVRAQRAAQWNRP